MPNHMIALVGKPKTYGNERELSASPIQTERKFHFCIAEIIVRLSTACVFAVIGVIGAFLCSFVFCMLCGSTEVLVLITKFLLCVLPTLMFAVSFKYT